MTFSPLPRGVPHPRSWPGIKACSGKSALLLCTQAFCFPEAERSQHSVGGSHLLPGGPQGSRGWRWNACGVLLWHILPLEELCSIKILLCLADGAVEAACEAGEVRCPELIPEPWVHNSDLSTEEFDTSLWDHSAARGRGGCTTTMP